MSPTSVERVQQLEHAQRLLKLRLDQIHVEQQRLLTEQNRLWMDATKIDTEIATTINSHLVDA